MACLQPSLTLRSQEENGAAERRKHVIEEETVGGLDFPALRDAIERGDAEVLAGFYAEDSELRIANAAVPEGATFELRGREQIKRYLTAVCDQEPTRRVEQEHAGEGSVSFVETCEYPDGARVLVRTTLEVRGDRIVRQLDMLERPP
jgi:SnoaL-like domain